MRVILSEFLQELETKEKMQANNHKFKKKNEEDIDNDNKHERKEKRKGITRDQIQIHHEEGERGCSRSIKHEQRKRCNKQTFKYASPNKVKQKIA